MKTTLKTTIYSLLIAGMAGAMLSSCNDFVDVVPKGKAIPQTVDDFGKMMNNSFLSINGDQYYFADVCYDVMFAQFYSDDYTASDNPADQYYYMFAQTPSYRNMITWADEVYGSAENDDAWNGLYKSNYVVNYIIQNIDNAEEGYAYNRDEVKGRALVHRALNYFLLTAMYGKAYNAQSASTDLAVPLILEPDINLTPARATVADCFKQILADLDLAISIMKEDYPEFNHIPGRAAAYATRARVNHYMQNYDAALADAQKSLAMHGDLLDYNTWATFPDLMIAMMGSYNPIYLAYASMFGMEPYPGANDRITNKEITLVRPNQQQLSLTCASDKLLAITDMTNDLRAKLFFCTDYSQRPMNMVRVNQSGINVSEMYLTVAEAALRKSSPDLETASAALETVRKNRYLAQTYAKFEYSSREDLLAEVMKERRREITHCVMSFVDKKRWNCCTAEAETMTRTVYDQTFTMKPGDPRYALQIPANVRQMNPNLVPNER